MSKVVPLDERNDIIWDDEPKIDDTETVSSKKPIQLVPMNRGYTKQEKASIAGLQRRIDKFEDPERLEMATEAIGAGATVSSLSYLIGSLQREELRDRSNFKQDQSLTVDRKKAKQKYSELTGQFKTSLDSIDYLVDNFNDDYVGWGDTMLHKASRVFDFADTDMGNYRKRYSSILPNFKKLENMGASFTESEQQMLKNIMPEIDSGDTLFRSELINFTEILKSKIENKLNALEEGDYGTGELKKIVDDYDKVIKKGRKKFNLSSNSQTTPNAPKNRRSIVTGKKMTREEKIKFLRGTDEK